MNTNLFHNILNVALIAVGCVGAALLYLGCVTTELGTMDCSNSIVNPAVVGAIAAVVGVLKVTINAMRDGLRGLSAPQPPVQLDKED